MVIRDVFEASVSVRKTVWSRRGDVISQHNVEQRLATDIDPLTKVATKEKVDGK